MSLVNQIRSGSTKATLVLLHGYGADENDLMGLAPMIPSSWTIVAFRGPRSTPMGGHSWFDIDFSDQGIKVHEDQVLASRVMIEHSLDNVSAKLEPTRLVLAGFSQGAMMTFGLISSRPKGYAGAAMLSGGALDEFNAHPKCLTDIPILVQHGVHDPIVPVDSGRRLAERCKDLGADVTFTEYPMEHQISERSLADFVAWLNARA